MAESQREEILGTCGSVHITPGPCGPYTVAGRRGYRIIWHSLVASHYTSYPTASTYVRAFLPLPGGKMLVLAGASLAHSPAASQAWLPQLNSIIEGLQFSTNELLEV
jgi:hypothetical protein